MDIEREMAVEAMRNLGWEAKPTKRGQNTVWEFRRPDDVGSFDFCTCRQKELRMAYVAKMAMAYGDAPDLLKTVKQAENEWLKTRFFGIYKRADEKAQ